MTRDRLPKGVITMVILTALWDSEGYGYSLQREVERITGQPLSRGEVYSMLRHLEIRGFVEKVQVKEGKGRRSYYKTTGRGREFLIAQEKSMNISLSILEYLRRFIATRRPTAEFK